MWRTYWRLRHDPFHGPQPVYVPNEGHEEAVARVAHAVENACRLVTVRGGTGLGKSVVLNRAVEETRSPFRRFARVACPTDTAGLLTALADGFGRGGRGPREASPWRRFGEALRLARVQRLQPVAVIDDAEWLRGPGAGDLDRLVRQAAGLTVVLAARDLPAGGHSPAEPFWSDETVLGPLTHSEAARFVSTKLRSAGREAPAFEPDALTTLYDATGGVPAALERLATLALMAGADRNLDRVDPSTVSGVAAAFFREDRDRAA